MEFIAAERLDLSTCIEKAQSERIVITQDGAPVAIVVGVAGQDREQLELGASEKFWELVRARREEPTISRTQLESRVKSKTKKAKQPRK